MTVSDTTPTAANETLVPAMPSYVRWNEVEKHYEISTRLDPRTSNEQWTRTTPTVRDILCETDHPLPLGNYIFRWARAEQRLLEITERNNKFVDAAHRALQIVGQRLLDEAEQRGWCAEFDEIIDDVNSELPAGFELPTRVRNFVVEVTVTGTHTTTTTVTVEAKSEDEAQSMVDDDPDSYFDADEVLTDSVRYDAWDHTEAEVTDTREA